MRAPARHRNDYLRPKSDYVIAIAIDLSGSFSQLMAEDGKAYEFALRVVDRYYRDRVGTNDTLIISQISGNQRALLWHGKPLDLRRQFPSAASFRDFLLERSNPGGSLVNEAFAQTLDYLVREPNVSSGRAKSALFVLSDMLDNSPERAESLQKVRDSLADYGRLGGVVGLYYVDMYYVPSWQQTLQQAGLREYHVESEIVGSPVLPSFD